MPQNFRYTILLLALLVVMLHSDAAQTPGACNYVINGTNGAYFGNPTCTYATLVFGQNASQNSFYCSSNLLVKSVTFGSGTFNNTLYNCTFYNATIASRHNAVNNIISPYGTYNFSFDDNYSNIALGYYFNFVPLDAIGRIGTQGFASLMPYGLEQKNWGLAATQGTTLGELVQEAKINGYMLPRFGVYAPGPVTNGKIATFKLETEQIYKNRTVSYEPYWFICPFWGWDELTFKTFYIYGDMNFTPTLIYPDMLENIQYPDNTSIFWNYTIIKYDNAPNMTLYLWKGYQVAPDGKIIAIFHNVTNGSVSYDRGIQSLGVHETIAVLKSPQLMEHDNSTTETYGVGLSFCTENQPPITLSGYYSLTYGSLHRLNTFWITNQTCAIPLTIQASNVTINCKGGAINSTEVSVSLVNARNVTLENCKIYGNAVHASYSTDINLQNSTLYANNATNTAITAEYSKINLANVTMVNYAKQYNLTASNITASAVNAVRVTKIATTTTTTVAGASESENPITLINQEFNQKPQADLSEIVGFVLAAFIIAAALYFASLKVLNKGNKRGARKTRRSHNRARRHR
ncbi:MAG: hypothetical protein ACP5UH_01300 [Candidatus Micrarchaeia archaeon]